MGNKILLAVIDKVVFGIIVLAFGLFIESRLEESKNIKDTILTVSNVNTEIIMEQRKRLNSSMTEFIQGFRDLRGRNNIENKLHEQLSKNIKEISNSLSQIESLGRALGMTEGSFSNMNSTRSKVQQIQENLASRTLSDTEIDEYINQLRTDYKNSLETVRLVSIRSIERDRKEALKHLNLK